MSVSKGAYRNERIEASVSKLTYRHKPIEAIVSKREYRYEAIVLKRAYRSDGNEDYNAQTQGEHRLSPFRLPYNEIYNR